MFKRLLVVLFVLTSIGIVGYANIAGADVVQSGLISCWSFDAGTITANTVRDIVDGKDGAITGALGSVPGRYGDGLGGGGLTDYVQVDIDTLLGPTTITVWAMAEEFTGTHYVFGHTTIPTWNNRIQIYCDTDGQLDLGLGDSHARHTNIVQMEIGVWHHIALAYDATPAGNYQVYIDGSLAADGAFTGLSDQMGFADISNDGAETGRDEGWVGVIDEFCLYDRVLNADEIMQNYLSEGITAVNPSGKLGAVWGKIKTDY